MFLLLYLNIFHVAEQRCLHHIPEEKSIRVNVKFELCDLLYPLPVALLHGLVQHPLQEGTELVEVIDLLLEVVEGLPFLETFGKLPTSSVWSREKQVKDYRK